MTNYNANDQLASDAAACPERSRRDANGNTTASGSNTGSNGYVYDFENRLIQQGGIAIVYDGDGNRVQKAVAGVTTTYLVDTLNPTGYAQVLYETAQGPGVNSDNRAYVYGLERISQQRSFFLNFQNGAQTSYYLYDGHGSVRALADPTGAATDSYDYDAFGNLIHSTGATPNNYLFAGEQYDPDLHLYYNRARYLNADTGGFWSIDTDEGLDQAPVSLHKYLYVLGDPVNHTDRTGHFADILAAAGEGETIDAAEAEADSLALRIFSTLTNRGVTVRVLGAASALIPEFKALETAFEENEDGSLSSRLRSRPKGALRGPIQSLEPNSGKKRNCAARVEHGEA